MPSDSFGDGTRHDSEEVGDESPRSDGQPGHSRRAYWSAFALGVASGGAILLLGLYVATMQWATIDPPSEWGFMVGLSTMIAINKMNDKLGPALNRWFA